MKLKLVLILALQLPFAMSATSAFAADNTSAPAASAPGSQAVFVVAPEDLPAQNTGVQIDTPKQSAVKKSNKPDMPIRVWSGPVPLAGSLWVLVASMPVLASLYFAYQLILFIRARRRRLSTERNQ